MNITNNTPTSMNPIKKQWKEPQIILIAQNDIEAKHNITLAEHTLHKTAGGHYSNGVSTVPGPVFKSFLS